MTDVKDDEASLRLAITRAKLAVIGQWPYYQSAIMALNCQYREKLADDAPTLATDNWDYYYTKEIANWTIKQLGADLVGKTLHLILGHGRRCQE